MSVYGRRMLLPELHTFFVKCSENEKRAFYFEYDHLIFGKFSWTTIEITFQQCVFT